MIKIGLLPLYLKLYDDCAPGMRPKLESFYAKTADMLAAQGFDVVKSPFCRIEPEFKDAVAAFEREVVECVVTLHMAYSPSLECVDALAATKLPIVVLDITEDYDFSPAQMPSAIDNNHGIHGVMDMCSLLLQRGKVFEIAAGHPEHSDVIARAAGLIRAAASAGSLKGSKVGTIGGAFAGMGDFAVSDADMQERFGVAVVRPEAAELRTLAANVTDDEVAREMDADNAAFKAVGDVPRDVHAQSTRDCLAVRKWIEEEDLAAFTVNFMNIGPDTTGLSTMPFMEASKAMARGVGYAGEGDVLTAAFTGAIMRGFPDSSFVEIFCPDWKGNTLFLSHMGEMNINLAGNTPEMFEREFIFGDAGNPVVCSGSFKSGEAVFVNVFRGADGFGLLAAPVTMVAETGGNFACCVRGWMKPEQPIGAFLEDISRAGVTHHSILVYGAKVEDMRFFGKLLGLNIK